MGLVAPTYYLVLSMICFANLTGINSVGGYWLVTIAVVIFIVIYVTLYMRQAEAREQAQALLLELEKANRQLSEYADRVEDLTIANERQRMARELHDTLSQGLAGLILQLEAADANLAKDHSDKARVIIQQSMQQARATLESPDGQLTTCGNPNPKAWRKRSGERSPNFQITPASLANHDLKFPVDILKRSRKQWFAPLQKH